MIRILLTAIVPVIILTSGCTPSRSYLMKHELLGKGASIKDVRVLILKTASPVKISCKGHFRLVEVKSGTRVFEAKNRSVLFYPRRIQEPVSVESFNSHLSVNGNPYRGRIEIRTLFGKVLVINIIPLEKYLYSVVPSEIPALWEMDALKAQAVTSRTYAYYHLMKKKKNTIYDLDSSTGFQVYRGMKAEKKRTTDAVRRTSGEIMTYQNKPILAYFHSTSGGRTIDDKYVWKNSNFPYLVGVPSPYGKDSPHWRWKTRLSEYQIRKYISRRYRRMGQIRGISFRKYQGRVYNVKITHSKGVINISGNNFRLLFPSKLVKSTYFDVKSARDGIVLMGRGWGHGVGLCQWSARGMAVQGAGYRAILKHFYRNIEIVKFGNRNIASQTPVKRRTADN